MLTDQLEKFIADALQEDIASGDHTTLACIPPDAAGKAVLLVKQEGVIAGIQVACKVFATFDPTLAVEIFIPDGTRIKPGDQAFMVTGKQQSILQTERLVLNILQRMSGIATRTALFAEQVTGTPAKILDTRKTTPNMRFLEKEAVRIGGGHNHRMGLYDMILIKDNHIDYAGGITQALDRTISYLKTNHLNLTIEIEARNLEDVLEILKYGKVNRILLDNFTPERLMEAIHLIGGQVETEASGGINLENIRNFALTGVDFISIGGLTHQIFSIDMSLKAIT
ncbi:MAG: carboxylating nicotinate-nucleotide diphosphorylase [Bacteroidia bacterium]|nr:carboxylating nicotinate-nucleotide diphosphorylase [Bacteroidia bacterium]